MYGSEIQEERFHWASKHDSVCLNKAKDNEPVFVLLGRDATSPKTVLAWIADNVDRQPVVKLRHAFECAMIMIEYRETLTQSDSHGK